MNALSLRQASNCENAHEPQCRCRCGGKLHGAKRGDGATFFATLPASDPHRLPTNDERRELQSARLRLETQRRHRIIYADIWSSRDDAELSALEARVSELEAIGSGGVARASTEEESNAS